MVQSIALSAGRGVALVDDADLEWLSQYRWRAYLSNGKLYTKAWITPRPNLESQSMHRLILPGVAEVDHANGNGLDNQRHNLRPATRSQQMMNRRKSAGCSSQFKGVSWNRRQGCWEAYCGTSGKDRRRLGTFADEIEAARAYDAAAREMFGEFARLNFP
jgi:hypothetical protein